LAAERLLADAAAEVERARAAERERWRQIDEHIWTTWLDPLLAADDATRPHVQTLRVLLPGFGEWWYTLPASDVHAAATPEPRSPLAIIYANDGEAADDAAVRGEQDPRRREKLEFLRAHRVPPVAFLEKLHRLTAPIELAWMAWIEQWCVSPNRAREIKRTAADVQRLSFPDTGRDDTRAFAERIALGPAIRACLRALRPFRHAVKNAAVSRAVVALYDDLEAAGIKPQQQRWAILEAFLPGGAPALRARYRYATRGRRGEKNGEPRGAPLR
jgi:hypothetical protein